MQVYPKVVLLEKIEMQRTLQILFSVMSFWLTTTGLADIKISLTLSSNFLSNRICVFENLEKDFPQDKPFDIHADSFGNLSSYRNFLNSPVFKLNKTLYSIPQKDLDDFFHRQSYLLCLNDIQWCLYLYLSNTANQNDSMNEYQYLYQIVNKLLMVSRHLEKVSWYDNDKIQYSSGGLVIRIDTFSVDYGFERITRIGNANIEYSADKLVKIGGLKISYEAERIMGIGYLRNLNKPVLNQNYKKLTSFERKEYMERQRALPGFIAAYSVLRLYIENLRLSDKEIPYHYLELYAIIDRVITASLKYRCGNTIGGKTIICKFGRIIAIDTYEFHYFFDRIQRISDFEIEYLFGQISKVGGLQVKWEKNRIIRIGDQKILK